MAEIITTDFQRRAIEDALFAAVAANPGLDTVYWLGEIIGVPSNVLNLLPGGGRVSLAEAEAAWKAHPYFATPSPAAVTLPPTPTPVAPGATIPIAPVVPTTPIAPTPGITLPSVMSVLEPVLSGMMDTIRQTFQAMVEGLAAAFSDLTSQLTAALNQVNFQLPAIGDFIGKGLEAVTNGLVSITSRLTDVLNDITTRLTAGIADMINRVTDEAAKAFIIIQSQLSEFQGSLAAMLDAAPERLIAAFVGMTVPDEVFVRMSEQMSRVQSKLVSSLPRTSEG